MKKSRYYKLWYEIKHYIAFKYGINYNSMEIMEILKDILDYMDKLEKTITEDK